MYEQVINITRMYYKLTVITLTIIFTGENNDL